MFFDCLVILYFMLWEMISVVKGFGIYFENMYCNMNVYGGVVFSQCVLFVFVGIGMSCEEVYWVV